MGVYVLCGPTLEDKFQCLYNKGYQRIVRQLPVVVYNGESIFDHDFIFSSKNEVKIGKKNLVFV